MEIVNRGQGTELALAEAMAPMVKQRELAVASLHREASALERIGASTGDLLEGVLRPGIESLKGMIGLARARAQSLISSAIAARR